MSRRPADNRIEQNRATLKSLVKLEVNKSCADCKKNKHPRWASWNLGIFVCIRCSGIHRGMGTHISKVKSVDLDSWTDEQTQSMLKWGNGRANKYWEAKLAPGHVPSDSKMENFIRTKYDSKRWVMDGPMPDPSTLGGDTPAAQPAAAPVGRASSQRQTPVVRAPPQPAIDLFGDDDLSAPARPATGPPLGTQPPPKAQPAAATQSRPAESLLGLDFFGTAPAPAARPASVATSAASSGPSKTDLKQSILSLYASAPRATPQPQVQSPGAFGGLQNQTAQPSHQGNNSLGGMPDAFSALGMGSSSSTAQSTPSAFSNLTSSFMSPKPTTQAPSIGTGGSFFDSAPKSPPVTQPVSSRNASVGGFGDLLSSSTSQSKPTQQKAQAVSMSNDLFDLSSPAPATTSPPPVAASNPVSSMSSAFNLSSQPAPTQAPKSTPTNTSNFATNSEGWGSSDVWGAPEPPKTNVAAAPAPSAQANSFSTGFDDAGWGAPASAVPKSTKPAETTIAGDEDFGGWNSAPTAQTASSSSNPPKPSGGGGFGGGGDDLFGNVWG